MVKADSSTVLQDNLDLLVDKASATTAFPSLKSVEREIASRQASTRPQAVTTEDVVKLKKAFSSLRSVLKEEASRMNLRVPVKTFAGGQPSEKGRNYQSLVMGVYLGRSHFRLRMKRARDGLTGMLKVLDENVAVLPLLGHANDDLRALGVTALRVNLQKRTFRFIGPDGTNMALPLEAALRHMNEEQKALKAKKGAALSPAAEAQKEKSTHSGNGHDSALTRAERKRMRRQNRNLEQQELQKRVAAFDKGHVLGLEFFGLCLKNGRFALKNRFISPEP